MQHRRASDGCRMTAQRGPTRRAVLTGAVSLAAAMPALGKRQEPDVAARVGRFIGHRLPSGVSRFLGIRYGRAARFQAPLGEAPQQTAIRAVEFAPAAPQRGKRTFQSEDCLFLNIWTPAADRRAG